MHSEPNILAQRQQIGPKLFISMCTSQEDSPLPGSRCYQRWRAIDWVTVALVALGAGLRIFQYLTRTSLWGDELSIALNVSVRAFYDLVTHPLASDQMAPSGFLLCLKLIIEMAGLSEYSLRLIPLLSSLVALPLYAIFSRRYLSRPAMLVALGAFALSPPLIRYAAQVKPYASDVALCLLCLLAADRWIEEESPRNSLWLAAAGAASIWFSYPVMFVVASVGLIALARLAFRSSSARGRQTCIVFGTWILSISCLGLLEQRRFSPDTHTFMLAFWANWLMPHPMSLATVTSYLVRLGRDCFSYFLHLPKWPVFLSLLLAGFVYLVRRSQSALLLAVPVLSVLAASMLRVYPFSGRLILFLLPSLYIMMAAGVEAVAASALRAGTPAKWHIPMYSGVFSAGALVMCVWPLWKAPLPYYKSETRPMIAYLGSHRNKDDAIYVHNMAWAAYLFYGPESGLSAGDAIRTSLSSAPGQKPLFVLTDLDQFRGRPRVWILFGGGYPVEQSCALEYLDSIGTRLDRRAAVNASVYLYDLSHRWPFAYAGAENFFLRSRYDDACAYDASNPIGAQE